MFKPDISLREVADLLASHSASNRGLHRNTHTNCNRATGVESPAAPVAISLSFVFVHKSKKHKRFYTFENMQWYKTIGLDTMFVFFFCLFAKGFELKVTLVEQTGYS